MIIKHKLKKLNSRRSKSNKVPSLKKKKATESKTLRFVAYIPRK